MNADKKLLFFNILCYNYIERGWKKQGYFFDGMGNFLMEYAYGNFGFLKQGRMEQPPLVLLDLGIERRFRETYYFENSVRASYGGYLLQFTLKGCGIYEAYGHTCHKLTPGWGFFSKMPEDSRYYLPSPDISPESSDEGWEFFYLHFDGPAARPFYETVRALTGPVFSLAASCPPTALFLRLFEKLKNKETLALYEGSEFLYRFLAQLLSELEAPSAKGSLLVQQAVSYFKNHFSERKGIGEAAELCNVSQAHLTRIFRQETGQTPLQYLTRIRMEYALFLLLNTQDSMESISEACGFLNRNYFAKVFRRHLGCSPTEYRNRSASLTRST